MTTKIDVHATFATDCLGDDPRPGLYKECLMSELVGLYPRATHSVHLSMVGSGKDGVIVQNAGSAQWVVAEDDTAKIAEWAYAVYLKLYGTYHA